MSETSRTVKAHDPSYLKADPTTGRDAWRVIADAPKDGAHVIVCTDVGVVGEAFYETHDDDWYWSGNDWTDAHNGTVSPPVLYWQPLPEPPAAPATEPESE